MARGRKKKAQEEKVGFGLLWIPVMLFFLLLSGLSVFYIWERIKLREIKRDIVTLERARREIYEENQQLKARTEELASYRRIYKIATERFGYVELKPKVIISPE